MGGSLLPRIVLFFLFICMLPKIGLAADLGYFDLSSPQNARHTLHPNNIVGVELQANSPLVTIPSRFYGINIHPGSVRYELSRLDLLRKVRPDAIRVMTLMRSDWPPDRSGRVVTPLSVTPDSFDWTALDLLIRSIVAVGAEPYLALGFGPPQWISGAASPLDRRPPQPDKYEAYASFMATITHRYAVEKGWPIKRVTVDNEPENVGYAISDYMRLVRLAKTKIKDRAPGVQVGGPAIGYAMWKQPNAKPLGFGESVRRLFDDKTPFDFFDWHIYSTSADTVMKTVETVRRVYGESLPLVISELNRDWRYSGEHRAVSMRNNTSWESVAWLAYLYDKLQLAGVDQVFYFAWREQTLGLLDARSSTVRPNFYLTAAMTNMLGRNRVATKISHPAIGAIATVDAGVVSALIYNMSDANVAVRVTGAAIRPKFSFGKASYEGSEGADVDLIDRALKGDPPAFDAVENTVVVPAGGFVVLK